MTPKLSSSPNSIVIGIDPGTVVLGYAILQVKGKSSQLLAMGVLKLDKYTSHYKRLQKIHEGITALIQRYQPEVLAIEAPFFGKNVQSMLKLGRAQGAAIVAAQLHDIPVVEYAPAVVKKTITGYGRASKERVQRLLQDLLHIPEESMMQALDASDAVAVALCYAMEKESKLPIGNKTSWADFIRKNPNRVKQ